MIGFKVAPKASSRTPLTPYERTWNKIIVLAALRKGHSRDINLASPGNLLGIMPWLRVGMCLRRSLIGLSIGSLALQLFPQ